MKNKSSNHRNKSLAEFWKRNSEHRKGGKGKNKSLGVFTKPDSALTERERAFTESDSALTERDRALTERDRAFTESKRAFTERDRALTERERALTERVRAFTKSSVAHRNQKISAIIMLALAQSNRDYIPNVDGNFDEWQKNYVKHLSAGWPPPEEGTPANPLLYIYLGIPEDRYKEMIEMQKLWTKDFARGGKKTDRRTSEAKAKQETRKLYEALLRSVTAEYIHSNRKASVEIKSALKLTVPDTEPSTVHGSHLTTLAPAVTLKNMGGGKIDVRFSRPEDDNRANVPKGFDAELRYVIEIALPPDPEDISVRTTISSSKARFQIEAGMTNKKKTLRSYARWRHRKNSAFHSPWTTVMEIDIV